MKNLIYLSAPYTTLPGTPAERAVEITNATATIMHQGLAHVFSPITHNHPLNVVFGTNPGWGFWSEYDSKLLSVCDEVWVLELPNWRGSRGVAFEIDLARKLGKQIRYVTIDCGVVSVTLEPHEIVAKAAVPSGSDFLASLDIDKTIASAKEESTLKLSDTFRAFSAPKSELIF